MEMSSAPVTQPQSNERHNFIHELSWFVSGAILPLGSLTFYRRASQRSVGLAILFLFTFTTVITTLTTATIATSMAGVVKNIRDEYRKGTIPTITIASGIAEVDAQQPVILVNEQSGSNTIFVAIDTTGQITSIDRSRYTEGFLLTRTELHVLSNNGRYQAIPLFQINALFKKDPLVIDEAAVSNAWIMFTIILAVFTFIFLIFWNFVVRLMFISMIALIIWGIAGLFRPGIGFNVFIIIGLYAVVPAVYISHLFDRAHAYFISLQTILLFLFWIVALVASLSKEKFFSLNNDLHLWTASIGVPLLVWFVVDDFVKLPSPYGEIILWVLALLTIFGLAGVRLYLHVQDMQKAA